MKTGWKKKSLEIDCICLCSIGKIVEIVQYD